MAKEPSFPKRDLNQAAVDAISTRIDAYEQAWQRRWEESDKRWDERMDCLFEGIGRIDARVEEIAGFIGQAAELQIQTQHKIDALGDKIDRMVQIEHERDLKWDARMNQLGDRIDRISSNLEASQQTVSELTRLVTVLVGKVAA